MRPSNKNSTYDKQKSNNELHSTNKFNQIQVELKKTNTMKEVFSKKLKF